MKWTHWQKKTIRNNKFVQLRLLSALLPFSLLHLSVWFQILVSNGIIHRKWIAPPLPCKSEKSFTGAEWWRERYVARELNLNGHSRAITIYLSASLSVCLSLSFPPLPSPSFSIFPPPPFSFFQFLSFFPSLQISQAWEPIVLLGGGLCVLNIEFSQVPKVTP